ncbi:hypothetical protein GDI1868 [Gluconacetobacter diazotrophicus PA1 5]|uniref:Uncharacterized protein n=1 Tax=Gluconacetobacter diazotrophicus (strain ATCC 49037 / DSM 5601 / CCUG 37298 / CIP 103539 / LMG 7603 / PAl5) TaxID=272568 RepID=A9HIT2_GLUDA|nr:hypothetical protein GDI1868 [Gluconacetobacter diazotrophicus PA1 5]
MLPFVISPKPFPKNEGQDRKYPVETRPGYTRYAHRSSGCGGMRNRTTGITP